VSGREAQHVEMRQGEAADGRQCPAKQRAEDAGATGSRGRHGCRAAVRAGSDWGAEATSTTKGSTVTVRPGSGLGHDWFRPPGSQAKGFPAEGPCVWSCCGPFRPWSQPKHWPPMGSSRRQSRQASFRPHQASRGRRAAGDGKRGAGKIADGLGDGGTHRGDVELGCGVGRAEPRGRASRCGGKERDKTGTGGVEEGEGLFRQGLRVLNIYYCNICTNARIIQLFQYCRAYLHRVDTEFCHLAGRQEWLSPAHPASAISRSRLESGRRGDLGGLAPDAPGKGGQRNAQPAGTLDGLGRGEDDRGVVVAGNRRGQEARGNQGGDDGPHPVRRSGRRGLRRRPHPRPGASHEDGTCGTASGSDCLAMTMVLPAGDPSRNGGHGPDPDPSWHRIELRRYRGGRGARWGSGPEILSSQVLGQTALHEDFGGVVPEIAARAHAERLDGCGREALAQAGVGLDRSGRHRGDGGAGADRRRAVGRDAGQGAGGGEGPAAGAGEPPCRPCADAAADRRDRLSLSDAAGVGRALPVPAGRGAGRLSSGWAAPSTTPRARRSTRSPSFWACRSPAARGRGEAAWAIPRRFPFPRPLWTARAATCPSRG
jgi:hypothetical protein